MDKMLAILLVVAVAGCAALGLMLRSAQAGKEAALADKARLSVVIEAQSAVIDAMQADAEIRDRALAARDRAINDLNTATFATVEAIGRAVNDPLQCFALDDPLPAAVSAPLFLLYVKIGGRDRAASDQNKGLAGAVSTPARAGTASAAPDDAQSQPVGGPAHGMGR
jgi:hypothetical protein